MCRKNNINFNDVKAIEELEEKYENFYQIIKHSAQSSFKLKPPFNKIKFSWWSPKLRTQRNKVKALCNKTKN